MYPDELYVVITSQIVVFNNIDRFVKHADLVVITSQIEVFNNLLFTPR